MSVLLVADTTLEMIGAHGIRDEVIKLIYTVAYVVGCALGTYTYLSSQAS